MGIRIITDSTADLPKELVKELGIVVVPLTVNFGQESYVDGVDLNSEQFYNKLSKEDIMPTTSQVPPDAFIQAFEKEIKGGNSIIGIFLSSKASGTYQSAVIAKQEFEDADITVIDSTMLCMGMGLLVMTAAQMAKEGKEKDTIIQKVESLIGNIEHLFAVDTLKYLKKGGRIKATTAVIGEVLNIKPILNVEEGLTQTIGKVRGDKKVIPYFIEHMKKNFDREANAVISVCHAVQPATAQVLIEKIRTEIGYEGKIVLSEIGAVIGTHAGPGVIAVFYKKKQ